LLIAIVGDSGLPPSGHSEIGASFAPTGESAPSSPGFAPAWKP